MAVSNNNIKNNPKFIYLFAYYNLHSPSVRYRWKYPLDFLKSKYGINSYFITPSYRSTKVLKFLKAYFSALFFRKENSLIIIQRISSNFIYSNALKLLVKIRKINTIYDLDDADYIDNSPKTIYYFIKNCSCVTVGSNELIRNLSKINKNIILNTSPTPNLNIVKKNKNPYFTIGWIGEFGGGHKESLLKYFFPSLKNLPFQVKLILLGVAEKSEYEFLANYFKSFENILLEMPQGIDWTNEEDIQKRISTFDIGIATLLDDELHRSKSAFKTKQYFNNGVPVLSSDLPENNLFITHGKNGFLCRTSYDFMQRIIEIHEMSNESYTNLSANARQSIHNFDLSKYCHELINIYNKGTESIIAFKR